jgi:hypothetical protein
LNIEDALNFLHHALQFCYSSEVFRVESFVQPVVAGFNLKCTKPKPKIYKDKFGHVCVTTLGPVRLQRAGAGRGREGGRHPCYDSISDILFQHKVKEHLHENGFIVDRFLISSQGAPYFETAEGDAYTACVVMAGHNVDFVEGNALLDVVAHVARMHHVLGAADIAFPARKAKAGGDAAKLKENLTSLKKKLLKVGKFSDFDMLFLRGYEELAPHVVAFGDEDDGAKSICHNLLKEENIYRQGGQIALTNFGAAAQMHYLHDLAYIIKRYIKAGPKEIMPIDKILECYAAHCDKTLDDALFRRILLYPEKFIKLTNDYYSKKRSFAPGTFLSRMQECLRVGKLLSENL